MDDSEKLISPGLQENKKQTGFKVCMLDYCTVLPQNLQKKFTLQYRTHMFVHITYISCCKTLNLTSLKLGYHQQAMGSTIIIDTYIDT